MHQILPDDYLVHLNKMFTARTEHQNWEFGGF